MVNGLSRLQVPAFASFNLLHLKRCLFSASRSTYPERIDRRKKILVNSNYKEFFQYSRGFFCVLCAFKWFFYQSYQTSSSYWRKPQVFRYAIKTSLSLNYKFTISLLFLNFKLPHIGQRNYQTCRPASKLVCKVRLTAVNNRTSLSLDAFIADTKK